MINENTVQFKKVIFENTKYIILEILVLHTKTILPEIIPLGKIAGIENIIAIKSWQEKERQSFLSRLFYGKLLVQIIRPIFYLIAWIAVIILISLLVTGIGSLRDKLKQASRRKIVIKHFGKNALDKEGGKKILLNIYIERGSDYVRGLQKVLENKDKLVQEVHGYSSLKKAQENMKEKVPSRPDFYPHIFSHEVIYPLIDKSVITIKNDKEIQIDSELNKTLYELLNILNKKEKKI